MFFVHSVKPPGPNAVRTQEITLRPCPVFRNRAATRCAVSAESAERRTRDEVHREAYGGTASKASQVYMYDTTLRDGAQGEGISLSVDDKLRIAHRLDEFGAHYIEGGWPGSNPKDVEFFDKIQGQLNHGARIVAFGSTRYKWTTCKDDANVQALVAAQTPVVTIVGKTWDMQVDVVLEAPREENLAMIGETVQYLKEKDREVMLDCEHFYDGFKANEEYAIRCLSIAADNNVDVLVLCDTNGGSQPWEVEEITAKVVELFPKQRIGIHCHNDMELATANSLSAIRAGASVIQGTCNGYGERTGNANLMSIIPNVQLKMGRACVGDKLSDITKLSRFVDEIANQPQDPSRPFVGSSAFAHKGGLHVAAILKDENTYQHIDPSNVGNVRRVLVSELSGRGNIITKAKEMGIYYDEGGAETDPDLENNWKTRSKTILASVKKLENKGYTFEGAEATVELMIRRSLPSYLAPFTVIDYQVITGNQGGLFAESLSRATMKMELIQDGPDNEEACTIAKALEVGEGNGPVDALNQAMKKALMSVYPTISSVLLTDYKVRILDNEAATAATTRVMIQFMDSESGNRWTTVAADPNIIIASVNSLVDGFEYAMLQRTPACATAAKH